METAGLRWALAAILVWSTTAVATRTAVLTCSPLWIIAIGHTSAALAGLVHAGLRGQLRQRYTARPAVHLLGLAGIGGYALCYNTAFAIAPAVEVNLLNYLWPLLTVLVSAPLARQELPRQAVGAALVGFSGAALVVTQGHWPRLSPDHAAGYLLALCCAADWAIFSSLLRRFGDQARGRMGLFSAETAVLAWALVVLTRPTPPAAAIVGLAIYLGLFTTYLANVCWDRGLQTGHVPSIGILANVTPALSTLWLVAVGEPMTPASLAGMALILSAAWLGLRPPRRVQAVPD